MIDHKQELWDDLDQLRNYALTVKRAAAEMLDWCHQIETDMQMFIEEQTKPEPVKPGAPFEPGFPCINPDRADCRCYEGCTADCLPSKYLSCNCPLKIQKSILPEPVENLPFEPGSPCIDPDGAGCRCYEGCTADCLPSEYQSCKCPRKISKVLKSEEELEPEPEPFVPGSPCINPGRVGGICYKGCQASCSSTAYKNCRCPRKVSFDPEPEPEVETDEPLYTLTEKGELIMKFINEGYRYLDACRLAEILCEKE